MFITLEAAETLGWYGTIGITGITVLTVFPYLPPRQMMLRPLP